MNRIAILLTLILSAFSASMLSAQPTECIDFSDQEPGTEFRGLEEGTIIAQYPGIANVSYEAFRGPNDEFSFGWVIIDSNSQSYPQLDAPRLFLSRAAVGFDFWGPVNMACFDINLDGGQVVFGVNGQVEAFSNWDDPSISNAFPNIDYSWNATSDVTATVCVSGFLERLTIGGEETALDNVCVDNTNSCLTENIYAYASCLSADTISIQLDFTPSGELNNDFFDLYFDDEFYGFYSYTELPLELPVLWTEQDDEDLYIRICENDNPECCTTERIHLAPCVTEGCIGFELAQDAFIEAMQADDPLGMTYYEEQGVSFTLVEATRDGNVLTDRSLIRFFSSPGNPTFPNGESIVVGHQHLNSFVDLSGFPEQVTEVTLDFAFFGSDRSVLNFSANDQDVEELRRPNGIFLTETTLTDGTRVRVQYDRERPSSGTITFIGANLQNVTVGGEEVMIDNFCLGQYSCNTRFTSLGQHACGAVSDTAFLYFDLANYPSQSGEFELLIDGAGAGLYSYEDLPLTNIPTEAEAGDTVRLSVVDLAFGASCTLEEYIYIEPCETVCDDFRAEFMGWECYNGIDPIILLALSSPVANQEVIITIPGRDERYVTTYGVNGILLEDPFFVYQDVLEIFDALSGCSTLFYPLEYIGQNPCLECDIVNLQAAPIRCDSSTYTAMVNFELATNDPAFVSLFSVFIDGVYIGSYAYEEFPLRLEDLEYESGVLTHTILVQEEFYGRCIAQENFEIPCQIPCFNFSAIITDVDCNSEEDYIVTMMIGGSETGRIVFIQDFFGNYNTEAVVSDENTITFSWPLTIGFGAMRVIDEVGGCEDELDYSFNSWCEECELQDILLSTTSCERGRFALNIQFIGAVNLTHSIYVNGSLFLADAVAGETYTYTGNDGLTNEDMPLYVQVAANGFSDCRISETLTESPCTTDCEQDFARDWETACNDNSPILEFLATDPDPNDGSDTLFVDIAGVTYVFPYEQDSYRIEMPLSNAQEYEVVFYDPAFECEQVEIIPNPCFCFIDIEEAVATPCSEDGYYFIELAVTTGTTWNEAQFILEAGPYREEIPRGSSTTRLGPFDTPVTVIEIFETGRGGCSETVTITTDCEPLSCDITLLEATATPCTPNGIYYIEGVFDAINYTGPYFAFVEGDDQVFPVIFGEVFRIGPFNVNEFPEAVLHLAAGDQCEASIVVVSDCDPIECEIVEFNAEATPCSEDGAYFIEGIFDAINSNDAFFLAVEGVNLTFPVETGNPFRIGPFFVDELPVARLIVFNSQGCAAELVVEPDCEPSGVCGFTDLVVEPQACDGEAFLVDISFENAAGGAAGFYVFGNGSIYGPFAYNTPFVTIGPLDGSRDVHTIMILDIADPSCFANYTLDYSCSEDCNISEVVATAACDGEVYYVELDVEGRNLGETFTVVGNGQNYGVFSYEDLPLNLGPFDLEPGTLMEFGVIDLQNPACTNFTEIEAPNCQPCSIRDLTYEVDCHDGNYELTIDFIHENPRAATWFLELDGEVFERFSYADLPLSIRLDIHAEFIQVRDTEDPDCSSELLPIDIPCCDMRVREGQVQVSECQEDGSFYLVVGEVAGTYLSDSLLITYAPAGSSIVETITTTYASLPLEIGPLTNTGQTSYQVVLSDAVNECAQSYQVVAELCDNSACVEFEGFSGIYNTALGYEDGDVIYEENGVALSYELPHNEPCNCILFGVPTASVPGVSFGAGQGVFTESSGFGLNFSGVEVPFNTVNMDFYYPGGGLTLSVNGADPLTVEFAQELPTEIAPGVSLQVTIDPNDERVGMFTFSGEIQRIEISTSLASGFDNVCMSQDDNVWPGDGNSNGIADHYDLLNLGIAFGSTGPARTEASSEWNSFIAANWRNSFADGLNYKHADTNGDGLVDAADREVLVENYGLVHGEINEIEALPYTDLDPPIFVDMETGLEHRPGGQFEIPIVAGSLEAEMSDVYGMAFTVQLDPTLIDLQTIEIVYPVSWFGDPEVNTMTIHRLYPDGRLEVALSRIDGNNVSGHGTVVYVRGLIDDIAGLAGETVVLPDQVVLQNNEGIQLPARPEGGTLLVTDVWEETFDADLLRESFTIFPNPAQDRIFFRNVFDLPVDHLSIFAVDGRMIYEQKAPGNSVNLHRIPAGVYMVKARIQGQVITERLVKTER